MSAPQRRGPPMGMWIADPKKPVVVINASGKNIIIYPTQPGLKVDNSLSTGASSGSNNAAKATNPYGFADPFNPFEGSESDRSYPSSQDFIGPMLGAGTNLMMPGLLHGGPGMEHILGGQVLGPPEAFYPFRSVGQDGVCLEDDDDEYGDGYAEVDQHLNMDDYIDYGDDSLDFTEEHEKANDDFASTTTIDFAASTSEPTPVELATVAAQASTTQDLLHHLDKRGVVGAFRNNHDRVKARLRQPALKTSTKGLPGGIKGGRHAAVDTPFSPLRKRKTSHSLSKESGPLADVDAKMKVNKRVKRTG